MDEALTIENQMAAPPKRNINAIINDYTRRLMGFIRKKVRNEADAEDILQDVFYQLAGNTEPIEELSGWLFSVTRNKITDRQRKQKPLLLDDLHSKGGEETWLDWAELFFDPSDNPETDHLRMLFWETLNAALQELPEAQRLVFIQHELEDIPFKTIAEQTGESINTLISRKRYAVLHLRNRLEVLKKELLDY